MSRAVALCTIGLALLALGAPASAQMTLDEAREAGRALGNETRADDSLVPRDDARAAAVPGFSGTELPQGAYFDDPNRLEAEAARARSTSEPYRITTDADGTRPAFSIGEIRSVTARGTTIETDPSAYLAGEEISAASGSCTPLPPGAATQGYYEASCNRGGKVEDHPRSCTLRMVADVTANLAYRYYVVPESALGTPLARYEAIEPYVSAGTCRLTGISKSGCAANTDYGWPNPDNKFCNDYNAVEYECSADIVVAEAPSPVTGASWHAKTGSSSVVMRKVDDCGGLAGDATCERDAGDDVCTEGPETRIIAGVPVTEACWAWQRGYTCHTLSTDNNCGALEQNRQCTFLRTECLDEPDEDPDAEPYTGPCRVEERIYRCPTPGDLAEDRPQYICGDDVYCINGDCEPIVREASTEFRDALVALHSIDRAGKEFDEASYKVFSGERETCHKPVFGLINCCAGKVSGALTLAAGGAALAGGPASIAALATPFLVLFACSQEEMQLDIKDRMGFCHKVGTYCSKSFLGICSSKRTAYCCFESKLSRILQEQGRTQIGKPWGEPKKEQCTGFSIDEFAQLDLSKMDFTEVYAEFIDAAKLPDEVETLSQIQRKIEAYYELHGQ